MTTQAESEQLCLLRLTEMDEALARMQRELPEDIQVLGDRARSQVQLWQQRVARGGADLEQLSVAMRELTTLLEALAARLLLQPWAPARGKPVLRD
jgi:hypothetical protein